VKYLIVIEQVTKQEHQVEWEANTIIEALDQARALVKARNKTAPSATIFSVQKVEEVT
jgi:hypothetical protein